MTRAPSLGKHLERLGPFDPDAMPLAEARSVRRRYYVDGLGYASPPALLTPPGSQPKLRKSVKTAYGLSLAPADMSGWDACAWRTPTCTAVCVLATGGRSGFAPIRKARVAKTRFLADEPQAFVTLLADEIRRAVIRHGGIDIRLNVASDLRWERFAPALLHIDGARPYDYTKAPASQRDPGAGYALTFSVSEKASSAGEALEWLRSGGNVAAVFERPSRGAWDGLLPDTFLGFPVLDGDMTDSRWDDAPGAVVGLRAKGDAIGIVGTADGFVKPGRGKDGH
jgi:hypothetical protein